MNLYRIEYCYFNGSSDTDLVRAANRIAANRIAAYEMCKDSLLPNFDEVVYIHCELEKEEEQDEAL